MEWLEQLKASGPLAIVLGTGIAFMWRAYQAKDAALTKSYEDRIADLMKVATESRD